MVKVIVLSGWIVSILTVLVILLSTVYLLVSGQNVPEMLKEWAGICLGFLFGTLMGMIKDYIEAKVKD